MQNLTGGKIVWDLDIAREKWERGLSRAKSDIAGLDSAFRKAEEGSQMVAVGLAGIAGAVGFGLKITGEMESLRASLDTLTGSTEAGAKMYKQLYDFAAKTPFETTELAKATQTMLSFGTANEDIMPNLRMLGDISMGNKEKLAGLSLAFSQIQSTGRLMGQDLLQMINNGFNPLQVISQKTGKTMATLKGEMEDGAISFDMVRDAMVTATSEGGLFFGGMERGSKTLSGVMSTLNDTILMTVRRIFGLSESGEVLEGGLIDSFKKAITGLTTFIAENEQDIVNFINNTFGWLTNNIPLVSGLLVGALIPALYGVATAFFAAVSPLLPFVVIGGLLGILIDKIVKSMGGWENVMKKIQPVLDFLGQVFRDLILPQLQGLWDQINKQLLPALQELWSVLQPVLIPVLKVLGVVIGVTLLAAFTAIIAIIRLVIVVITEWVNTINNRFAVAKEIFKSLPESIKQAFAGLYNTLTKPFSDAYNFIKGISDKIKNALDKINPYHRNSPSLVDNVKSGVDLIKKQYASLGSLSIAPITSQVTSFAATQPNISSNLQLASDDVKQQGVTVNVENLNNINDIESLGRELAFRLSIA